MTVCGNERMWTIDVTVYVRTWSVAVVVCGNERTWIRKWLFVEM